jgi:tetratricopeptide (TPR) repeat protein
MAERLTFAALVFAAALGGCASGTPAADSPSQGGMSSADARTFIAEVQKERGMTPGAPVSSMEQFLEVLDADDLSRFESASAFVAGKPGIDAMTLHAALELSWSDACTTVARIAEELGKREAVEVKRLTEQRDSGRTFTDAQGKELERLEKSVAFLAKAREALDVLAKDHLDTALGPVNEALRQFPKDRRTYRVAAFYYLLAGDWEKFDTAAAWLEEGADKDAGVVYIRALETLRRFAIKKEARERLRAVLAINPKLVRAQAKLVLLEEGVAERHAELEKLRALSPKHPVVSIAGPEITSEYEMAAAVEKARGPAASPAPATPAPASPASATPAPAPSPATPEAPR